MKKSRKMTAAGRLRLSTVLLVGLMLLGFALLLYPTVADTVNTSANRQSISDYQRKVESLDRDAYEKMLSDAQAYNAELFTDTPYIGTLTGERRAVYNSLLDMTGTGILGYIEIEKLGLHLAIYHGTDETVLQTGIGHLEASSLPVAGESVHTVLTGHSGLPSARLFTDLDQLELGDTFVLRVLNESLTYRIEDIRRVSPDQLEDMCIEEGQELCTLITCTPYGVNTHRLVLTGRRIEPQKPVQPSPTPTETAIQTQTPLESTWTWRFLILPGIAFVAIWIVVLWVRHYMRKKKRTNRVDS